MQLKTTRAFRTISEAGEELGLQPHVLRFWESKFPQIKPMKRGGGRRFYRPEDIEFLRGIKILLHEEKHPIKDVQKLIRVKGASRILELGRSMERASKPKAVKDVELIPQRIANYEPEPRIETQDSEILRPISAPPMPATTAKSASSAGTPIAPVVHSVESSDDTIIRPIDAGDDALSEQSRSGSDGEAVNQVSDEPLETVSAAPAATHIQEEPALNRDALEAALARLAALRQQWDDFQSQA